MSLWSDPESRERRKPLAECPLFESGLSTKSSTRGAQCETGVQHIKAGSPLAAPGIAHARNSDPETSHAAARSIVNIGPVREKILHILGNCPRSDEDIWARYQFCMEKFNWPPCSPSGLRSRRSELVRMGFVVEGGTGKTAAGRNCTIWRLA